jgi:hypothetical protein
MFRRLSQPRRARGQILPWMVLLLSTMMIVAVFMVNVLGFQSLANRAAEDAGHQAGLASLQQVDHAAGLARWEILPMQATAMARQFAVYNLVGMTEGTPASAASYAGFFDLSGTGYTNLTDLLNSPAGTQGDTVDGLDVEIIIPAQDASQTSDHYLNCDPDGNSCLTSGVSPSAACDTTGQNSYPQAMSSSITGQCYVHSVIILRFRLHAIQLGIGGAQIEQVVVTQAGTNG